jgi:glycosyltransferase involved in cell wall biosynthesis
MLSVIIAYVNEYPQLVFTIRSIAEELLGRVDFEIIAVNNYCEEVAAQGITEDKGAGMVTGATEGNLWLKSLHYNGKLSHWQAKNLGVKHSKGDFIWFPDAHVVPKRNSVFEMLNFYQNHLETLNGTLHMPIGYQILEWRKLIYGLVVDPDKGAYFYKFIPKPESGNKIFEVPCMSTCGCLMHRSIYDKFGGWPEEIGIYGGGEPFFNFSLAVMGMKKYIWNDGFLYHYGEQRGYSWNHDGWLRDELIASFCYGGDRLAKLRWMFQDGHPEAKKRIWDSVMDKPSVISHREKIASQQRMEIEEWVEPWIK